MKRKEEKKKHPLCWLLLIPGQLLLDGLLLFGAVQLDVMMQAPTPETIGHPMPAITLLAFFLLAVITLLVVIVSLIMTVRGVLKEKRRRKEDERLAEENSCNG